MFNYVQRLGKALMLPVAVLPVCAILMGIGYALAPAAMGSGGETTGFTFYVGSFLINCGKAIIDNIAVLFAVGVALGMAKKNPGIAALSGVVSWLIVTNVLSVAIDVTSSVSLSAQLGSAVTVGGSGNLDKMWGLTDVSSQEYMAFSKIENPFTGMLCGIIASVSCNKFSDVRLPDFLSFFSGKRCVAIMTALFSVIAAVILGYVWPVCFTGLLTFGQWIASLGGIGAGIYMFFNRLLIPVGLHHALNNIFWFDTVGIGDLTNFWAGKTASDCSWSLGMYMSGFFPCMMFGVPGAALAMILCSKNRKATAGILGSVAICAFLCGVTEPFEFLFMFLAFPLYVIYALLYGIVGVITYYTGFRAGFSFSGGFVDLVLSSTLPAAQNTWMIIPLGIGCFVGFFLIFYFYCKIFKIAIPGSDEGDSPVDAIKEVAGKVKGAKVNKDAVMAEAFLIAAGGKENIVKTEHCVTRLRLTIADPEKIDDAALTKAGAKGVVKPAKDSCQIIIGPQVEFVYEEFIKLTGE